LNIKNENYHRCLKILSLVVRKKYKQELVSKTTENYDKESKLALERDSILKNKTRKRRGKGKGKKKFRSMKKVFNNKNKQKVLIRPSKKHLVQEREENKDLSMGAFDNLQEKFNMLNQKQKDKFIKIMESEDEEEKIHHLNKRQNKGNKSIFDIFELESEKNTINHQFDHSLLEIFNIDKNKKDKKRIKILDEDKNFEPEFYQRMMEVIMEKKKIEKSEEKSEFKDRGL